MEKRILSIGFNQLNYIRYIVNDDITQSPYKPQSYQSISQVDDMFFFSSELNTGLWS